MRNYEAIVIFSPNAEEEVRKQVLDRINGIIENGGTLTEVDEWGMRKLAYLIDDFSEAYYVLYKFQGNNEIVAEFDRVVKISDSVIRHMIVRIDE